MTEPMGERGRQGAAPLGGHTPGPWVIHMLPTDRDPELREPWIWQATLDPDSQDGAGYVYGPFSGYREADLCLIAAAPELLEAAANVIHGFDADTSRAVAMLEGWAITDDEPVPLDVLIDHLRAAIAKARGEQ